MAARVKIRSSAVNATLRNRDVIEMFHGVLGTGDGGSSLAVSYPKYLRIKGHIERFVRLLGALGASRLMRETFPEQNALLCAYVEALRLQQAEAFCAPDLGEAPGEAPPEAALRFSEVFAAAKKCSLVNAAVVTCKNLIPHKKSLQEQGALRDGFLSRGGGTLFCPLPDLALNFRQVYIDDRLKEGDREFVLIVLHKMYAISHDVYEAVSAPDVDVGEFAEVIMESIKEVRRHIPRCDQAFAKIVESVEILKGNFGGYYKDYVASNNPTIIMENFVLDVSKTTKATPLVTAQFRKIIAHYRKLASQQASHPKLQSLFQQVDANFQELESRSRHADTAGDDDDD